MCDTQGAGEKAPVVDQKLSIPLRIKSDFQRKSCPPECFFITFFVSVLLIKIEVLLVRNSISWKCNLQQLEGLRA